MIFPGQIFTKANWSIFFCLFIRVSLYAILPQFQFSRLTHLNSFYSGCLAQGIGISFSENCIKHDFRVDL